MAVRRRRRLYVVEPHTVRMVATPARLSAGGPDAPTHAHTVDLDDDGNGRTTIDAGHFHEVHWLTFGHARDVAGAALPAEHHRHDVARRA